MLEGKRKFIIALFLGSVAFTAFMFTVKDIACLGAFLGFLGLVVKMYNDANVEEHKNGK